MPESISLDAKQDSIKVIDRARTVLARSAVTVPCQAANAVIVDVICEGNYTGTVVIYGNNGSAWMAEADPNSSRAVAGSVRYVVLNVSQTVAAGISAMAGNGEGGITVILTPLIAAANAVVNLVGTAATDLAQYGGSNVGPANPLDVQPGPAAVFSVAGGVTVSGVTAARLQFGRQAREAVACAVAGQDYPAGGAAPAWAKYVVVSSSSDFRVAFGESSAAAGIDLPSDLPVQLPIAGGGDGTVHVQCIAPGASVNVTYLAD